MTPQQRIEQTRRALQMAVLGRVPDAPRVPVQRSAQRLFSPPDKKPLDQAPRLQSDNRWLWDAASSVAQAWWMRQPAYAAVRLAEPALSSAARRHPWRLLGVAALIGAGVAVLRPWRAAAVRGALAASVRTPSANDMVGSLTSFMRSWKGGLRD